MCLNIMCMKPEKTYIFLTLFSTCSADFLTFVLESSARRRRRARFSLAAFKQNVSSSYQTMQYRCMSLVSEQTLRFVCLTVRAEAVRAADLHSPEWQSAVSFLSLLTPWNTKSNLLRTLQTKCRAVKSGLCNKASQFHSHSTVKQSSAIFLTLRHFLITT